MCMDTMVPTDCKITRFQTIHYLLLLIVDVVTVKLEQLTFVELRLENKRKKENNSVEALQRQRGPTFSSLQHHFPKKTAPLTIAIAIAIVRQFMENPTSDSLSATLGNSIQALGRGFDVTSDIRLLYCKGAPGSRLVHVDEDHTKNLLLSHDLVIPNVSMDVDWSPGKDGIETTPVYSFHEVMMILFIPFSSTPFVSRFFFLA